MKVQQLSLRPHVMTLTGTNFVHISKCLKRSQRLELGILISVDIKTQDIDVSVYKQHLTPVSSILQHKAEAI